MFQSLSPLRAATQALSWKFSVLALPKLETFPRSGERAESGNEEPMEVDEYEPGEEPKPSPSASGASRVSYRSVLQSLVPIPRAASRAPRGRGRAPGRSAVLTSNAEFQRLVEKEEAKSEKKRLAEGRKARTAQKKRDALVRAEQKEDREGRKETDNFTTSAVRISASRSLKDCSL